MIPGHVIPGHVIRGHVISDRVIPDQLIRGHVIPGHVIRGHVISDHVILDQLIRGHVISGHVIPGHVIPGHVIPGHVTQLFHVDQRGVVSSLSSIDREVYDAFRFPVVAEDAGTPSRTGSEPEPCSTIADGASRSLDCWPADPIPELSDPTGGSAVFLFCVASPSRTGFQAKPCPRRWTE